jgi:hypothetical protein
MAMHNALRNRGVADVFVLVCDGLESLPDSVNAVWPSTFVQTASFTGADLDHDRGDEDGGEDALQRPVGPSLYLAEGRSVGSRNGGLRPPAFQSS